MLRLVRHAALLLSVVRWLAAAAASDRPLAHTDTGDVLGLNLGGVHQYLSVPYAAQPTGAEGRWRPARAAPTWEGIFDASKVGAQCAGAHGCNGSRCHEDCLVLHVFTPMGLTGDLLPVLVFFPGGAFISGCDDCEWGLYNASEVARQYKVVVITVNYRLGIFGWLALPGTDITGNFGITDQRESLRWVQRNVKAFGGDPSRVTVWGESAGAMSILVHLATNRSQGLFTGAIMESNVAGYTYRTRTEAERVGSLAVKAVQACASTDGETLKQCLLDQNTSEISAASDSIVGKLSHNDLFDLQKTVLPWTPVVGAEELQNEVLDVFKAGQQLKVPVLLGGNHDEFDAFVGYLKAAPVNTVLVDSYLLKVFGPVNAWKITSAYPASAFPSPYKRISRIITDWIFLCSNAQLGKLHSEAGMPAYLFRFDAPPTAHGGELPYLFGNWWSFQLPAKDKELSLAMQDFWTSFAKDGHPSSSRTGVAWPALNKNEVQVLLNESTDGGLNITVDGGMSVCKLWDSVGYNRVQALGDFQNTIVV